MKTLKKYSLLMAALGFSFVNTYFAYGAKSQSNPITNIDVTGAVNQYCNYHSVGSYFSANLGVSFPRITDPSLVCNLTGSFNSLIRIPNGGSVMGTWPSSSPKRCFMDSEDKEAGLKCTVEAMIPQDGTESGNPVSWSGGGSERVYLTCTKNTGRVYMIYLTELPPMQCSNVNMAKK